MSTARGSCPWRSTRSSRSATTSGSQERGAYIPHGVNVITLRGDRIEDITTFLTDVAIDRLGLGALDSAAV